jgi:hypothetical protein
LQGTLEIIHDREERTEEAQALFPDLVLSQAPLSLPVVVHLRLEPQGQISPLAFFLELLLIILWGRFYPHPAILAGSFQACRFERRLYAVFFDLFTDGRSMSIAARGYSEPSCWPGRPRLGPMDDLHRNADCFSHDACPRDLSDQGGWRSLRFLASTWPAAGSNQPPQKP